MRKNIISAAFVLAALFATSSCTKEISARIEPVSDELTFAGNIEQMNKTKTVLAAGDKVNWESSDEININGSIFSVTPNGEDPTKATFTKKSGEDPSSPYSAYYPASIFDGTKATLPDTQIFENGKITNNPMYAGGTSTNLSFHNICGLVEFTLKGTAKVGKIVVTADAGGLSGDFTVVDNKAVLTGEAQTENKGVILDCGTGVTLTEAGVKFWIAIPAGSYTLTFTVIDTDGKIYQQITNAAVTVAANMIYAFEKTPTFANYLCFTALEAGAEVTLNKNGSPVTNALEYMAVISGTPGSWTALTYDTALPTLTNVGDKVYIRAKEARNTAQTSADYVYFTSTKQVEVSGNIMYLVDPIGAETTISRAFEFNYLFESCTTLKKADKLVLPATKLAASCYKYMFNGCSKLETAPTLPATKLATNCYYCMFKGCASLASAPALPATSLISSCYYSMFQDCTSLTTAPALPATTLANYCYKYMFKGCSKLTSITCLATDIVAVDTGEWVNGVSSTGTFTKASSATWPSGENGIPTGWTVKNYGE